MTQPLTREAVHVWCAEPRDFEADEPRAAARAILSADEIERLERFHFERDRTIYLATHWLARTVLSRYESIAPPAWRFVAGKYGRPEIVPELPPLRFNLSNTHGLVACAVTRDVEVGVDIERIARPAPLEVADRFFAPAEVAALRSLPLAEQSRRFFDYWTLKESYIKARGFGIALPLDLFAFVLEKGHHPRIDIDPSLGDRGERWQFEQHEPTSEHLLALCVERSNDREGRNVKISVDWQRPLVQKY